MPDPHRWLSLGPPPLTPARTLTSWTAAWPGLAMLTAVALLYAAGVLRARARGVAWSPARSLSFGAGVLVAALALTSFLGVYARSLFWVCTVQLCLLLLVAPLLMAVGGPLALARAALGPTGAQRLAAALRSRPVRVLGLPGVGPLGLLVVTAVVFFAGVLPGCLRHPVLMALLQLGLVVVGLALALPMTEDALATTSARYAAMLAVAVVEFVADALPGMTLRLSTHLVGGSYWAAVHRPWGPSPLADQQHAGAWLWFFAEAGDVPFLAALVVSWVRADAREAAEADELPAAPAAARPRSGVVDDVAADRPWWEVDASVLGEGRAQRHGWPERRPAPPDDPA